MCWPCATVWDPSISGNPISLAEETALIVWNSKTGEEHFIRQADFNTKLKDLGFLVPTPTLPTLAPFKDTVFKTLQDAARPVTYHRQTGYKFTLPSAPTEAGGAGAPAGSVSVVSTQLVAGYKATVLKATDSTALAGWLKANGFAMRPALDKWLAEYVKLGWYLTAFKFVGSKDDLGIRSPLVRITFQAKAPVYPYREPMDTKGEATRSLRLYVVSDVGLKAMVDGRPWLAKMEASFPLDYQTKGELAIALRKSPSSVPPNPNMSVYLDERRSRNAMGDLEFQPMKSPPTYLMPTPIQVEQDLRKPVPITVWLPLGVLGIAIVVFGVRGVWRLCHKDDHLEAQ